MNLIVPAVLPLSRTDLEEKLALFESTPSVTQVQIDVVDGRFAAPMSWPYTAPKELQEMIVRGEMLPQLHRITYEIDLMCLDALQAAEEWLALGASRLTFHAESITNSTRFLSTAQEHFGSDFITFGLALNVDSDLSLIDPFLDHIEYVQFMGIAEIGRQGQLFDRRVLEKIRTFHLRHKDILIQVDGGVSLETAKELIALGVTNLVVGSAILRSADPRAEVEKFERLKSPYGV